jgi:hypothetical protein
MLPLDFRSFAYWSPAAGGWRVAPGCYRVMVGRSSRDVPLAATVAVGQVTCAGAIARLPLASPPPSHRATPQCLPRRRSVLIRLAGIRAAKVRSVRVIVNGRSQRLLRGHRAFVRVDLSRVARRGVSVQLVIRVGPGRGAVLVRRYRTCAVTGARRP